MVDDYRESPQEKPKFANETKSNKREIDLFPALQDRRMMALGSARQAAPTRIGTQISIFSPVSFEEALEIVECLRARAATTISLENMKKLDASRLVDFVAGASAALDGDFHKLSEQVYVFCPANIKITAQTKNAAKESANYGDAFTGSTESLNNLNSLGMGALDFLYPGRAQDSANSSTWSTKQ
ncbi:MAG: cell division protein SepF [Candidatus Melainabacteria bacterium]|jgi:FtsZ-interacting cell division protein YlmF|uniref:Cell division protein SepF n=1 Tax=Candidatus Obscuribacter phosphatis TaxID=1906157 RepID=A0A8J7P9F2_9BACT|nr:cell division protein SepF [Candidatus Obscuribacter phosphatis]MCA0312589.1 cell division protein SepF [Candidatus Melainabacteria bacterium]OPZ91774.1 MAG: Cell division protein SepF [bacterium ADurb.Bin425]